MDQDNDLKPNVRPCKRLRSRDICPVPAPHHSPEIDPVKASSPSSPRLPLFPRPINHSGQNEGFGRSVPPSSAFSSEKYKPMDARYFDLEFFRGKCSLCPLIEYYKWEKFATCSSFINLDLCALFFHHLEVAKDTPHLMTTHIQGRTLHLTPSSFNHFLGLSDVKPYFFSFPSYHPDGDVLHSLDDMFRYFFGEIPAHGKCSIASKYLPVEHIPLYHFVLDCVLPVASRNRAMIRTGHLYIMYAMIHHHPIDLGFQVFSWISARRLPIRRDTIHMPFCHVITAYLRSVGVDVSRGKIIKLGNAAKIGKLNMGLIGLNVETTPFSWLPGKGPIGDLDPAPREESEDYIVGDEGHVTHGQDPSFRASDRPKATVPISTRIEELSADFHSFRHDVYARLDSLSQDIRGVMESLQAITDLLV